MKLLLTGGSGYLGQHILALATHWKVLSTYHTRPFAPAHGQAMQLNLEDEDAVRAAVDDFRPAVIVHTACSNRNAEHIRAIVPAARHLAHAAQTYQTRFIHISTDSIWDGQSAPYTDDTPPTPLNDYGRAKAEAESVVRAICPKAAIARPSLIWGLRPLDHQTRWLVDGAQNGSRVTLFTDEWRNPVYVKDLARAVLELAARPDVMGTLNLVGAQPLTRWEFGQRLLKALNIPLPPNVVPLTVAESGLVRASNVTALALRAQRELKTKLRGVDEVLAAT
jgi:dTDP-4-dehydrorhamnose reductase